MLDGKFEQGTAVNGAGFSVSIVMEATAGPTSARARNESACSYPSSIYTLYSVRPSQLYVAKLQQSERDQQNGDGIACSGIVGDDFTEPQAH